MNKKDIFTSKLGFVFSMMGIAIGAGNIWRFPRIVAQNGGGTFLFLWGIFLIAWSIPLIIVELSIGKLTKKSPFGTMKHICGKHLAWIGFFVTIVTTLILAYYSTVVGWGFSYFSYSISGYVHKNTDFYGLWSQYQESYYPLLSHFCAVTLSFLIIKRGIVNGIEKCNRILIPGFLLCVLILFLRAVSLPHAYLGLKELFHFNFTELKNYKIWIEALTQNAWDTGAGWGLLLVYAGFASEKTGVVKNGALTAIANNTVSLVMGIIVFASIASLSPNGFISLAKGDGSSSIGLAFIYLPQLFTKLPGHNIIHSFFSAIFFLAFSLAALSSMISMLFLLSQTLKELNIINNKHAEIISACFTFILGIPSSLSVNIFLNQDKVWGIALIINGLIIIYAALRYGLSKLKKNIIHQVQDDIKLGYVFQCIIKYIIPIEGLSLLAWYIIEGFFIQNINCWNVFRLESISNLLFQWVLAILASIFFNNYLQYRKSPLDLIDLNS